MGVGWVGGLSVWFVCVGVCGLRFEVCGWCVGGERWWSGWVGWWVVGGGCACGWCVCVVCVDFELYLRLICAESTVSWDFGWRGICVK